MFYVEWCDEYNRFVGKCRVHPLYMFYGDSAEQALDGIRALTEGLDEDNEITDVDMQYADTDEIVTVGDTTNTHWPPFFSHKKPP